MCEEESGEDGLFKDLVNEKGDSIPKPDLINRIKELDGKRTSEAIDGLTKLMLLYENDKDDEMEQLIHNKPTLNNFNIRNKNGTFSKNKLKAALKTAMNSASIPEIYKEEYAALTVYASKQAKKAEIDADYKDVRKTLDAKIKEKYGELTVDEIKHLLFDKKWMAKLEMDIHNEFEKVLNSLSSRVLLIAKRYEHTLREIEDRSSKSRVAVMEALRRMGYKW